MTNNIVINAKVTGVEDAEDFVKRLQQFGLTFNERSDTIYASDDSRLAFS